MEDLRTKREPVLKFIEEKFRFLEKDYGFHNQKYDFKRMYIEVGYEKGTLGIDIYCDFWDVGCVVYFYDASKGFPPDVDEQVIHFDYYKRYKLPLIDYKKIHINYDGLENAEFIYRDLYRSAVILKDYYGSILETDKFIYPEKKPPQKGFKDLKWF